MEVRRLLRRLEAAAVALVLGAALVPRLRDAAAPLDRDFDGFQGAFFAVAAIDYARLGVGRFGGYPVLAIDVPSALAAGDETAAAYLYGNHPPTVPLLVYGALETLAPPGWDQAWREHRPPEGIEPYLRAPFLLLHVLGLLAFWWALRQGVGAREALLGLALLAVTPVSILYAGLVNYENPSLAFVLLGHGFHARYARHGRRRDLALLGASFLAAGAVTFAPALFVPPLVLHLLLRREPRRAALVLLVAGGAVLAPLLAHGLWVRAALPAAASESVWARAHHLLEPLLAGDAPLGEWLLRQGRRLARFVTLPLLAAAALGLAVALRRARRGSAADAARPGASAAPRVQLGPPLALGGLLVLLAFYRHTWDGAGATDGQTPFLLNLAPGLAALAATGFDALAAPLARLRGGIAPLVLAVSLVALPALVRANDVRRAWRDPAAPAPWPKAAGAEIRALVPPGSVALHPDTLGLTPATAYYAWRTLLPVGRASYAAAMGRVEALGLADRPQVLLLPRAGPPAVLEQSADLRALAAGSGSLLAASDAWEVWALTPP